MDVSREGASLAPDPGRPILQEGGNARRGREVGWDAGGSDAMGANTHHPPPQADGVFEVVSGVGPAARTLPPPLVGGEMEESNGSREREQERPQILTHGYRGREQRRGSWDGGLGSHRMGMGTEGGTGGGDREGMGGPGRGDGTHPVGRRMSLAGQMAMHSPLPRPNAGRASGTATAWDRTTGDGEDGRTTGRPTRQPLD